MREKRGRRENRKTLDPVGEDGVTGKEGKGFFACYLLASLSPRHKGQTYIGFTVNPRRRIRQHNGEITSGAWRTKRKRPWEMVLCIYGFPTNVSALQFEWAWQHPRESLAVREAAAAFKSFSGLASKIKLVYTMLNLPAWNSLNLTVNYFSSKYAHHGGLSPSLPQHMKVQVCAMDDLPYFTKLDNNSHPEDEESPEGNEEEEDDSSNQSQPGNSSTSSSDDLYPGEKEKELHDRHFEKAKEPITVFNEDDRLANFSGFGLLEEETVEDEVAHSTVGSIEAMEKEPETVFLKEIVEDEVSHSTVGSTEAMEKEPETVFLEEIVEDEVSHGTVVSTEAMEKEPETVFLEEIVEDDVSHGTVGSTEAMEKDSWRRRNLITSTTTTEAEVEVIDLMTPSPSCRVGSSMKRRRVSEFIDLTMSPNFIEL